MKTVFLQFGSQQIQFKVPDSTDILSAPKAKPLSDPGTAIQQSLNCPIASASLSELANKCKSAAVVVSDNTRPVPYKGPDGILPPILKTLKQGGIKDIKIIVACGTHRPVEETKLRDILGDSAFQDGIRVINHIATDKSVLRSIGSTDRSSEVSVNRYYLDADLKIVTGLVEPHFVAGFSGGRKAICPGICGEKVTYGFHSANILNDPDSTSLILDGNPCHEESLSIAKMAGVDFIVNVTIDSKKRITGIFSGELEKAHLAAVDHLRTYAAIELSKPYDMVITQAGDVGINHYQCAKVAVEASRAVKEAGCIVLCGNLTDSDPVGGKNYKQMLELLTSLGSRQFTRTISSDDWSFVPEQWQVQMWAKVFEKLGSAKKLFICAPQLQSYTDKLIPETNIASQIKRLTGETDIGFTQRMMQMTIDTQLSASPDSISLVLPDGPYAVPVITDG
jgi:nickel-dependent lactate racemase